MRSAENGPVMPPSGLKGVIFDWDGVLASTMEGNYRAWCEAFAPHGAPIPRNAYFLLEGMAALDVARHFLAENGLDPSHAMDVKMRKEEYFLAHSSLTFYPGAEAFIASILAAGISLALVTGASRTRLQGSGAIAALAGFKVIVSSDDVKNGKPHPESYLKALEGLGLGPDECLVVENAPLGIRAAKQAGLRVMALTTTLPGESLAEADWILDGLGSFREWLGKHRVLGGLERKVS
jgi:beta-phosphoglucomutase